MNIHHNLGTYTDLYTHGVGPNATDLLTASPMAFPSPGSDEGGASQQPW